ncbi:MAG TPA: hypothetical protein VH416_02470 [Gaiellaceae bacterium]
MNDAAPLIEEITELLASPRRGSGAPPLEVLEDTLTTGYARALELDAERTRIERRIGEVVAHIQVEQSRASTTEIAGLAARLSDADADLTRLRALLEKLRRRAADCRRALTR